MGRAQILRITRSTRSSAPSLHRPLAALRPGRVPALDDAAQFLERVWAVVYLEAKHGVVVEPHATALLNDDHRRRLHAARVAARGLTRVKRGHQAHREMPLGALERLDHALDHGRTGENVALRGAERALLVAGPGAGLGTGEHRGVALQI